MMTNKAVRGLMYLLIGCCLMQLAMLARLSVTTADRYYRHNAIEDFSRVDSKLESVESRINMIAARQATTMKKLNLPFPSDDPATQP